MRVVSITEKKKRSVKMVAKQITSEQAFDVLMMPENSHTFFSGQYVKLDGTLRTFNGRRNVRKYLKGGELKYNPSERGNVIYYDSKAEDEDYTGNQKLFPRTIKTDRLVSLRINKQDYIIVDPPKVTFVRSEL